MTIELLLEPRDRAINASKLGVDAGESGVRTGLYASETRIQPLLDAVEPLADLFVGSLEAIHLGTPYHAVSAFD